MYYILVIDGKAHESIPGYDSGFPGVPIESRYSQDILNKCVQSETAVQSGWLYDAASGTCSAPPEPEPVTEPEPEAEAEPTAQEDIYSMMVDHEYRLTLMELGVTEGV
ncbi:MAG: hypothetical protein VB071_09045 [Lawsonibacter sp.]|nr:hypothetical protein [Lawsonibacter sp.]